MKKIDFYIELVDELNKRLYKKIHKSDTIITHKFLEFFSLNIMAKDRENNYFWVFNTNQKIFIKNEILKKGQIDDAKKDGIFITEKYQIKDKNENVDLEYSKRHLINNLDKILGFKFQETSGFIGYHFSTGAEIEVLHFKEMINDIKGYESHDEDLKEQFSAIEKVWGNDNFKYVYINFYTNKDEDDYRFVGVVPLLEEEFKQFSFHYPDLQNAVFGASLMSDVFKDAVVAISDQQIKTAIISILIDSYAHNISAHSLNYLQGMFSERVEKYFKKTIDIKHNQNSLFENLRLNKIQSSDIERMNSKNIFENGSEDLNYQVAIGQQDSRNTVNHGSLLDFILYASEDENNFGSRNLEYQYPNDSIAKIPFPLDYAISPLLKYLRDKGAFWSGILRDNQATPSQITDLYEILMEFLNNPLFLGSIMAAEEIFKIHVFIDGNDNIDSRHLLSINLLEFIKKEFKTNILNTELYNYIPEQHSDLSFVRLGSDHKELREYLTTVKVLLPGGVVGKHAFYTIIENTLRNAKHLNKKHIEAAVREFGLELHFSFREYDFNKDKGALVKVGVYLDYKTQDNKYKTFTDENEAPYFLRKNLLQSIKKSYHNIINEKGVPMLGGSSQDKICASALLTKRFTNVQNSTGLLSEFFPWIKYGLLSENKCESIFYDELKHNKDFTLSDKIENNIDQTEFLNYKQIFVKYFYLWRAENYLKINYNNEENKSNEEIIPRFIIGITDNRENKKLFNQSGITRLLFDDEIPHDKENSFADYYRIWNDKWIVKNLNKSEKDEEVKYLKNILFRKDDIFGAEITVNKDIELFHEIMLSHDKGAENANICKIRSHGQLLSYFFNHASDQELLKGNDYLIENKKYPNEHLVQELIETIFTRIIIIDNRLNNRFDNYFTGEKKIYKKTINTGIRIIERKGVFPNSLHLHVYPEPLDKKYLEDVIFNELIEILGDRWYEKVNFFVIHLSFIDAIIKSETNDKVGEFIDKYILKFSNKSKSLPPNFIFSITTGRGRSDWMDNLSEKHRPNCIHVPIESLQSAIDNGTNFMDDFDVKFNICKVLFGS